MNKSRFFGITLIGILVVNAILIGFFLYKKPIHPPNMMGPKKIIIENLHFDKKQINAYNQLIFKHKKEINSLKKEVQKAKSELYKTLNSPAIDSVENHTLFATISSIESEIERVHYDHFLDIKQLCRPDQLDEFKTLTTKMVHFFSDRPKPKK